MQQGSAGARATYRSGLSHVQSAVHVGPISVGLSCHATRVASWSTIPYAVWEAVARDHITPLVDADADGDAEAARRPAAPQPRLLDNRPRRLPSLNFLASSRPGVDHNFRFGPDPTLSISDSQFE